MADFSRLSCLLFTFSILFVPYCSLKHNSVPNRAKSLTSAISIYYSGPSLANSLSSITSSLATLALVKYRTKTPPPSNFNQIAELCGDWINNTIKTPVNSKYYWHQRRARIKNTVSTFLSRKILLQYVMMRTYMKQYRE